MDVLFERLPPGTKIRSGFEDFVPIRLSKEYSIVSKRKRDVLTDPTNDGMSSEALVRCKSLNIAMLQKFRAGAKKEAVCIAQELLKERNLPEIIRACAITVDTTMTEDYWPLTAEIFKSLENKFPELPLWHIRRTCGKLNYIPYSEDEREEGEEDDDDEEGQGKVQEQEEAQVEETDNQAAVIVDTDIGEDGRSGKDDDGHEIDSCDRVLAREWSGVVVWQAQ